MPPTGYRSSSHSPRKGGTSQGPRTSGRSSRSSLTVGIRREISSWTGRRGRRLFTEDRNNSPVHVLIMYSTIDQESVGDEQILLQQLVGVQVTGRVMQSLCKWSVGEAHKSWVKMSYTYDLFVVSEVSRAPVTFYGQGAVRNWSCSQWRSQDFHIGCAEL